MQLLTDNRLLIVIFRIGFVLLTQLFKTFFVLAPFVVDIFLTFELNTKHRQYFIGVISLYEIRKFDPAPAEHNDDTFRFSQADMEAALERVLGDAELQQRTAQAGERVRGSDGLRNAADLIEALGDAS